MRVCRPIPTIIAVLLLIVISSPSFAVVTNEKTAGKLLEYSLVKSFPKDELTAFFKKHHIPKIVLPVNNGLNVYEVVYTSTYNDGSTVKASGLLYAPISSNKELPLMIYNHGTEICRDRSCNFEDEQTICLAFAADGYIVITPDYMGLGKGERTQLFLNARAESVATVDMLIAAHEVLPQLNIKPSKQLFVTGYSQGGHASMATSRLLQRQYADRFPVTASSPMSGPYDIAQTVWSGRKARYDYPVFFFLLLQSYYESIGKPKDMALALNAPYDTLIPPLMDGNNTIEDIDKLLPDTIFKTARKEYLEQYDHDSTSGFRAYLKSNNVFDWKPEMPMLLCYCNADEEVPYTNSVTAYNTMKKNGSNSVELWRAGKKFGHENCAIFAVVYTKMFFDGFRDGHPGYHGPAFKRLLLNIGKLSVKPR